MQVSIQHVVGTTALIFLVISVGFYFYILSSYVQVDILKQQLGDAAEYVSLNLVEIVTLVNASNQPYVIMVKAIEMPTDIGGRAYVVEIINQTDLGKGCYVHVYMLSRPDIEAESLIPLNATQSWIRLETNNKVYSGRELLNQTVVVWGRQYGEVIEAGIGVQSKG